MLLNHAFIHSYMLIDQLDTPRRVATPLDLSSQLTGTCHAKSAHLQRTSTRLDALRRYYRHGSLTCFFATLPHCPGWAINVLALAALLPLALKHCLVCPQLPRVVCRNLHQKRGATATPSCLGKPVVLDRLCHGWQIHQVKNGYRFNGDDILLAREACRVGKIGQKRLLDLGSGA